MHVEYNKYIREKLGARGQNKLKLTFMKKINFKSLNVKYYQEMEIE